MTAHKRPAALASGAVMPALVAGIHALNNENNVKGVDGRDEPGHDEAHARSTARQPRARGRNPQ